MNQEYSNHILAHNSNKEASVAYLILLGEHSIYNQK